MNINRRRISIFSKGNEKERLERSRLKYKQMVNAFQNNLNNNVNEQVEEENKTYRGINNYLCDTNLKKKYHPNCSRGEVGNTKENRIKKIKNFKNEQKNIMESEDRFNRLTNFLNEKYSGENETSRMWRYLHEQFNLNNQNQVINIDPSELVTCRQKKFRELEGLSIFQEIKKKFFINSSGFISGSRRHKIQREIKKLFEDIQIKDKILFNFDFLEFKNKINRLKENELLINFLSKPNNYLKQLPNGEKSLKRIFGDVLFNLLKDNGILDKQSIEIYNKQFIRKDRESAKAKLVIWCDSFFNKIIILNDLIKERQMTKELVDNKIKNIILSVLENYLFYCNYVLQNYFKKRDYLLEWGYEGLYYNYMIIYFDFIDNFLNCNEQGLDDKYEIEKTLSSGMFGTTYKLKNKNINQKNKILKIAKNPKIKRFERIFFEFFKLCVLSHKNPEYFPEQLNIIFTGGSIYNIMEFINGKDLYNFYVSEIENINNSNINNSNKMKEKNDLAKSIFIKIGETIKILQENCSFVHNDLNMNNIMISKEEIEEKGNKVYKLIIKIIDVDFSILKYDNIFIFNFNKYIDINNSVYKNNNNNNTFLTNFAKSIDLLRLISYFCYFGEYYYEKMIKKIETELKNIPNEQLNQKNKETIKKKFKNQRDNFIIKYNLEYEKIKLLKLIYFGVMDIDNPFPENLDEYYKDEPQLKKYSDFPPRLSFPTIYIARKIVCDKFIKNMKNYKESRGNNYINRNLYKWKEKYYMWINNFIPKQFLINISEVFN